MILIQLRTPDLHKLNAAFVVTNVQEHLRAIDFFRRDGDEPRDLVYFQDDDWDGWVLIEVYDEDRCDDVLGHLRNRWSNIQVRESNCSVDPSKLSKSLVDLVLNILDKAGGVEYTLYSRENLLAIDKLIEEE